MEKEWDTEGEREEEEEENSDFWVCISEDMFKCIYHHNMMKVFCIAPIRTPIKKRVLSSCCCFCWKKFLLLSPHFKTPTFSSLSLLFKFLCVSISYIYFSFFVVTSFYIEYRILSKNKCMRCDVCGVICVDDRVSGWKMPLQYHGTCIYTK